MVMKRKEEEGAKRRVQYWADCSERRESEERFRVKLWSALLQRYFIFPNNFLSLKKANIMNKKEFVLSVSPCGEKEDNMVT